LKQNFTQSTKEKRFPGSNDEAKNVASKAPKRDTFDGIPNGGLVVPSFRREKFFPPRESPSTSSRAAPQMCLPVIEVFRLLLNRCKAVAIFSYSAAVASSLARASSVVSFAAITRSSEACRRYAKARCVRSAVEHALLLKPILPFDLPGLVGRNDPAKLMVRASRRNCTCHAGRAVANS